jgi:ribosomal protein L6P/L9E
MNGFTTFDRHAHMSSETRGDIMNILKGISTGFSNDMHLSNMLYGLFDGYLYEDIISESNRIGIEERIKIQIKEVVGVVSTYPKLQFSTWEKYV